MQQGVYNESTPSGYVQQGNEPFHDEDSPWPIQSREVNGQLAELETDPSSQGNAPSYEDGLHWPKQSREVNKQFADWLSGTTEDVFDGQLSAEPMRQTTWGNHYSAPPFPEANIPNPYANNDFSEGI